MAWLILVIVSWGALAFGANYDWARWPLLVACAVAGAWGFARTVPRERRRITRPILFGLVLVAAAVCVQLGPLDSHTIRDWSPATHTFLKQYSIEDAMAAAGDASDGGRGFSPDVSAGPEGPASIPNAATAPGSDRLHQGHAASAGPPRWVRGLLSGSP